MSEDTIEQIPSGFAQLVFRGQQEADATQRELARITREEFDRYNESEEQIYNQLQEFRNQDMVGEAKTMARADNIRVADMQKRMRARYGVKAATGQAAQAEGLARSLGDATNVATAFNTGQLQQRDASFGALGALVNQGNAVRGNSMSSLTNAANIEAGREAQYQQARAAHRAGRWNAIGSFFG